MNNKSLLIVLIICGLILSAMILRNGKLLLVAMPFLIYLITGAIQAPIEMKLLARRSFDQSFVDSGEPVEIQVVIENQGKTLINLYVGDSISPAAMTPNGQPQRRLTLAQGANTVLKYTFRASRGMYAWKTIRAIASDPFGLFELERFIHAPGEILVKPVRMGLRRKALIRPRFTLHASGPIASRMAGTGTDFFGIREYRAGDPRRHLNWRRTARHPHKMFTNEYEQDEIADYGLIVDARRLSNDETLEQCLFEHSLGAAASLAEIFLKDGNRLALLIFGEATISLFPGYGKRQLDRIMRAFARARLGSNFPMEYLEYFPTRLFPSRSILVIFSPVDSLDLETYARLRAFGYDVLLISPDPIDYAARMSAHAGINALAIRAARLERIVHLKQLMKLGVQVVDWSLSQPIGRVIQNFSGNLAHRRNI